MSNVTNAMIKAARKLQDDRLVRLVPLTDIDIDADSRRPVDAAAVERLAASIREIGLLNPIHVLPVEVGKTVRWRLVSGAHRVEAYRSIYANPPEMGAAEDWSDIPAIVAQSDSEDDARLQEIAENLHRNELSVQECADHISEWVRLTEERRKAAQVAHPGGIQPHDAGISAAARELGIDRTEIQRATKIASISEEAKVAAREAGLDDNQSALLKVARAEPEKQVEAVHEIAKAKVAPRPAPTPATAPSIDEAAIRQDRACALHGAIDGAVAGLRSIPVFLREVIEARVWEQERSFAGGTIQPPISFVEFVTAPYPVGLGSKVETIETLLDLAMNVPPFPGTAPMDDLVIAARLALDEALDRGRPIEKTAAAGSCQVDLEEAIAATTDAAPRSDWHARAASITISSGEGKGKRITAEALGLLHDMHAAGESPAEIGRVLGLAAPSVRHHLRPRQEDDADLEAA